MLETTGFTAKFRSNMFFSLPAVPPTMMIDSVAMMGSAGHNSPFLP